MFYNLKKLGLYFALMCLLFASNFFFINPLYDECTMYEYINENRTIKSIQIGGIATVRDVEREILVPKRAPCGCIFLYRF